MGYPLVGDVQYGGASVLAEWEAYKSFSYERLALQCCQLEFVDPDVAVQDDKRDFVKYKRSRRWNEFRLKRAWWTLPLEDYHASIQNLETDEATTDEGTKDVGVLSSSSSSSMGAQDPSDASPKSFLSTSTNAQKPPRPDLLPDRVQLSPGMNKYVLVRASHPWEPEMVHWFVKSASPAECGGPYHGNVAQDLREWIEAAGYDVVVKGGGRIDFAPEQGRCVVYGFSYGFGKGDHEKAARIIQEYTDIPATFDNADGLY